MNMLRTACLAALLVAGCMGPPIGNADAEGAQPSSRADTLPFTVATIGSFDEPWAMTFLPDGGALITERQGRLKWRRADGTTSDVAGVPAVAYGGQGGLGDVVLSPDFANDRYVYLSWVEAGDSNTFGAAVGRAKLVAEASGARLEGLQVIWRQEPKVSGRGHFGHRIAFGPDGMMYVSSGERQKFDPAQNLDQNLGKIVRLSPAGGIPSDNPLYDTGRIRAQMWSYGHRNPLGLAFDNAGRLWNTEMGPQGGDELNLVRKGGNYGYPKASNGDHYDGRDIPDHRPGDGFEAPKVYWNPAISPGSLMIYSGNLFKAWQGDAFIGALGGEALIRVDLDGENAVKADQWPMGTRIREVEQGPDGAIWLLTDGKDGKLLRLTPA